MQVCLQQKAAVPVRQSNSGRSKLTVRAVAEAEKTSPKQPSKPTSKMSAASTSALPDVYAKMRSVLGKATDVPHPPKDTYRGVAYSVRDHLIDRFNKTHAHWEVSRIA
jgi:starch phosphorylase